MKNQVDNNQSQDTDIDSGLQELMLHIEQRVEQSSWSLKFKDEKLEKEY